MERKRVLITGGTGFLGSHISDYIREALGWEVIATHFPDWDFRESATALCLFFTYRPNILINCAARVGGIKANLATPGQFFYDNLAIGMNLMEAARKYPVEKFVQIGSACEYPVDAKLPMREDDIWDGYPEPSNASYAIAKRALLEMGQAYRKEYGMNVIHLVPTNLYGPRDNFNPETSHVIPALIGKFLSGTDKVEILGNGAATRDFLFVKDAASMIVDSIIAYNEAAPLNLGSGERITINLLAGMISRLTNYYGQITFGDSSMNGQPDRILDTSRADALGIQARTRLEEGLKETIAWYRNVKLR